MTRIFGYTNGDESWFARLRNDVQTSIKYSNQNGWHIHALGMVEIGETVRVHRIAKGYQGITSCNFTSTAQNCFIIILNMPDKGKQAFDKAQPWYTTHDDTYLPQPLENDTHIVLAIGNFAHGDFTDTQYEWYHKDRPVLSVLNYISSHDTNLDWIDPKRSPVVVAINKLTKEITFHNRYQHDQAEYRVEKHEATTYYAGIRVNGNIK